MKMRKTKEARQLLKIRTSPKLSKRLQGIGKGDVRKELESTDTYIHTNRVYLSLRSLSFNFPLLLSLVSCNLVSRICCNRNEMELMSFPPNFQGLLSNKLNIIVSEKRITLSGANLSEQIEGNKMMHGGLGEYTVKQRDPDFLLALHQMCSVHTCQEYSLEGMYEDNLVHGVCSDMG